MTWTAKTVISTLALLGLLLSFCGHVAASTDDQSATIRFVDTAGNPVDVESALFFNGGRAKAIQVESGRGVAPSQSGIVVAKAEGFQFSGVILSGNQAEVVFFRNNEPCTPLKQSPYPLTDEIKSEVTAMLKKKLWAKVGDQPPTSMQAIQMVRVVADIDPFPALDWVKKQNIPAQMGMMARAPALLAAMRKDPEEVFDEISQIEEPTLRCVVLGQLLQKLPLDSDLLKVVESQLVEASRSVKQPALKLAMRATLAEHYHLTSRPALAGKIVDQHLEEVKKLPSGGWSAYPRSLYAALIAEQDPALARQLIEGIDDPGEAQRAQARVAFACCREYPDMAIELLSLYEPAENTITVYVNHIKVAHRMALEQTPKAMDLVSLIDEPNQRAWALGLIAMRLNKSKPDQAKELLSKAIDTLALPAAKNHHWFPVGSTLAGLLPIAQQVDPAKVQPMIWQAVYETLPLSRWTTGQSNQMKIQSVAGAIARYDLALGRALVRKQNLETGQPYNESAVRQAVLYPTGLEDYGERLFESERRRENRFLEQIIALLTRDQSAFWRSVSKPPMLDWPINRFENH